MIVEIKYMQVCIHVDLQSFMNFTIIIDIAGRKIPAWARLFLCSFWSLFFHYWHGTCHSPHCKGRRNVWRVEMKGDRGGVRMPRPWVTHTHTHTHAHHCPDSHQREQQSWHTTPMCSSKAPESTVTRKVRRVKQTSWAGSYLGLLPLTSRLRAATTDLAGEEGKGRETLTLYNNYSQ